MDILPVFCFLFGIMLAIGLVARSSYVSTLSNFPAIGGFTRLISAVVSFPGNILFIQRIWDLSPRKMGVFGLFFFVLAIIYSLGNSHDEISIAAFLVNVFSILGPGILMLLVSNSPLPRCRQLSQ